MQRLAALAKALRLRLTMRLRQDLLLVVHNQMNAFGVCLQRLQHLNGDGGGESLSEEVATVQVSMVVAARELLIALIQLGEQVCHPLGFWRQTAGLACGSGGGVVEIFLLVLVAVADCFLLVLVAIADCSEGIQLSLQVLATLQQRLAQISEEVEALVALLEPHLVLLLPARAAELPLTAQRVRDAEGGAALAAHLQAGGAQPAVLRLQVVLQLPRARDEAFRLPLAEADLLDQVHQVLEVLPPVLLAEPAETRLGARQAEALLAQILQHLGATNPQVVGHDLLVFARQLLGPQLELALPVARALAACERLRQLRAVHKVAQVLDLLVLQSKAHQRGGDWSLRSELAGVQSGSVHKPLRDAEQLACHRPREVRREQREVLPLRFPALQRVIHMHHPMEERLLEEPVAQRCGAEHLPLEVGQKSISEAWRLHQLLEDQLWLVGADALHGGDEGGTGEGADAADLAAIFCQVGERKSSVTWKTRNTDLAKFRKLSTFRKFHYSRAAEKNGRVYSPGNFELFL